MSAFCLQTTGGRQSGITMNEICIVKSITRVADIEPKNCILQDAHYEKLAHAVY
jgi:hypothetical protein